jgi:hypothetical protein
MRIISSIVALTVACAVSGCNKKVSEEDYKTKTDKLKEEGKDFDKELAGLDFHAELGKTSGGRAKALAIENAIHEGKKYLVDQKKKKAEQKGKGDK